MLHNSYTSLKIYGKDFSCNMYKQEIFKVKQDNLTTVHHGLHVVLTYVIQSWYISILTILCHWWFCAPPEPDEVELQVYQGVQTPELPDWSLAGPTLTNQNCSFCSQSKQPWFQIQPLEIGKYNLMLLYWENNIFLVEM